MTDMDKEQSNQNLIVRSVEEALEYAENIVDTVREPLLVLDDNLRVISANRSFYRGFRVSPEESEGRLVYELGNNQWDIPKLRELLEEILPQNTTFDDFEVEHEFNVIGRRVMLLNARRLYRKTNQTQMILLAFEDVTERKRMEDALLQEKERLQEALNEIKKLSGLLPICSVCKNIRDDKGYWNQIESYISDHSEAVFNHSLCAECAKKLYPDLDINDQL